MGETRGDLRMLAPEARLADRESFAEQRLRGIVQLELLVDTADGVEQPGPRQRQSAESGSDLLLAAIEQLARRDRVAAGLPRIAHLEEVDQELDDFRGLGLRLTRSRSLAVGPLRLESARRDAARQGQNDHARREQHGAVAAREFGRDIQASRRAGMNGFEAAVAQDVVLRASPPSRSASPAGARSP